MLMLLHFHHVQSNLYEPIHQVFQVFHMYVRQNNHVEPRRIQNINHIHKLFIILLVEDQTVFLFPKKFLFLFFLLKFSKNKKKNFN